MIRAATPSDAPALAAILGNWIIETGWMPVLHTPEDHLSFLGHLIDTTEVIVAAGPEPEGFLALDGEQVNALYLAPAVRGVGMGKALLDHVKTLRPRLTLWTFDANPRAIAFYLREGFAIVERTDGQRNAEKRPDLSLVWERAAG